jgi:hypothetical protein
MSSNWSTIPLMCAACAVAIACDGPASGPVGPVASSAASLATAHAGRARASGHADIQGFTIGGLFFDQRYSFTAVSDGAFPLAKGQVQADFLLFGQRGTVHATVTCVSVVGNEAWVGSRVKRFVFEGQEQPQDVGVPMVFRVKDMGEGHGVRDLATFVFVGFPDDLAYCNTRPPFPPIMRENRNGNIQVQP